MISSPEVGRTFSAAGMRSMVAGVLLPKVGFTCMGRAQFIVVPEVKRKKSCPHRSKTYPQGLGMFI